MQDSTPGKGEPPLPVVWDLPVRISHWLLVLAVAGAFATHYAGIEWFRWHRWCGYAVFVIVGFRIVWGFVGTTHARFAAFVRGPRAVLHHLRNGDVAATVGHNPLGAWSVLAMLAALGVQAVTGLFANDEIASSGPLYGWISHALSNGITSVHRSNSNVLVALVALHLAAVAWYTWKRRIPLVRSMVTGRRSSSSGPAPADGPRVASRALVVAVLVALALACLVRTAPDAAVVLF